MLAVDFMDAIGFCMGNFEELYSKHKALDAKKKTGEREKGKRERTFDGLIEQVFVWGEKQNRTHRITYRS